MRFIQIALASDAESGEILYALGEDGVLYEKTYAVYSPGSKYQGKSVTRGRAATEPFWRSVDFPFSEPSLDERKLSNLEFQEDRV